MPSNRDIDIDGYYGHIRQAAGLPTLQHARRWSGAVLKTLGATVRGRAKRSLAKTLPPELRRDLTSDFRLKVFFNPRLTEATFRKQVAMRAGNTDPEFSRTPTLAVFSSLKQLLPAEVERKVVESLPAEVAAMWRAADDRRSAG